VEITSAEMQQQLSSYISQIDKSNINNYWAGMTDKTSEGTFHLASNNKVIPYTNWSPNEPNQNGEEDCVQIIPVSHTWNDNACTKQFFAICQKID
jgi:hypothetical protein